MAVSAGLAAFEAAQFVSQARGLFVALAAHRVFEALPDVGERAFVRLRRDGADDGRHAAAVGLGFVDALQPHRQVSHISTSLPRDRDILVHCKGGARSAAACQTLAQLGFEKDRLF
jgi:hypothetical protein